jgi:hypothetical protein
LISKQHHHANTARFHPFSDSPKHAISLFFAKCPIRLSPPFPRQVHIMPKSSHPDPFVGLWLLGGIGNQMFQYAMGYALALRTDSRLYVDDSHFDSYQLREKALSAFDLPQTPWPFASPARGLAKRLANLRQKLASRGIGPRPAYAFVQERSFAFDQSLKDLQPNCYVLGYWQSPLYFSDCAQDIRRLFDLSRFLSPDIAELAQALDSERSVSIHLRRGDYTQAATLAHHGLCGMDYYEHAAALMRKAQPGCRFYIFSDEPKTAAEMFAAWPDATVMQRRSQEQDMLLMSLCRHHIIANSSFSWWAAWLGETQGALTIAPKFWFSRQAMQHCYVLDLFPSSWILL